jgi:hypothetical protein
VRRKNVREWCVGSDVHEWCVSSDVHEWCVGSDVHEWCVGSDVHEWCRGSLNIILRRWHSDQENHDVPRNFSWTGCESGIQLNRHN